MNLRAKVALSLAAIVLLVITIAGVGAAVTAQNASQDTIDRGLNATAKRVLEGDDQAFLDLGLDCNAPNSSRRRRGQFRAPTDSVSQIVIPNGVVFCSPAEGAIPVTDEDLALASGDARVIGSPRTVAYEDRLYRLLTISIGEVPLRDGTTARAAIQIARPFEDLDEVRDQVLRGVAMFGLLGAIAAAAVGWALVRRLAEPIETLTAASERVAVTQDLTQRIHVDRVDEVGRMGTSFNTMLDAIDASKRQQNQLVQDANHELRTPLTSLRTNIELLQRAPDLPTAERDNLLADIGSELGELTTLVEELVASATDVTTNTEAPSRFDLADIANDVAERARRRTGRVIEVSATTVSEVLARETMIDRAVSNLVNNAIKFSPDSFPIKIEVDGASVTVHDSGPGIATGDHEKIFDRFYRSDEARSQPGSGLGLSIVRQVATNHGGRAWAINRPGGGASIGFEIDPDGAALQTS